MADRDCLFLDANILVAGAISPTGGSGYILLLGEMGNAEVLVCDQVLTEACRALERKAPRALPSSSELFGPSNRRYALRQQFTR
jgi:predicted nucleic acid-binding protein